ncbi:Pyruvate dehydrogenase E1 component [Frankliniella fusca]|uniref:Pyruvate dehydrogenase E1 component n=1 Tax=Frankliniella fusca TaxID=407009 RepID=A0AAE1I555_9NEOP|nr:Pyruvate dehydrogenase E1 component [Frankliniella fusca]
MITGCTSDYASAFPLADTPAWSSAEAYPAWLQGRLHHLHHEVRDRAAAVVLRQKERYDIRARRRTFQVGNKVWLFDLQRRVGRCSKLQSWWTGPHVILDILNDVTARIQLAGSRCRPRTYHVDKLAPYIAR